MCLKFINSEFHISMTCAYLLIQYNRFLGDILVLFPAEVVYIMCTCGGIIHSTVNRAFVFVLVSSYTLTLRKYVTYKVHDMS